MANTQFRGTADFVEDGSYRLMPLRFGRMPRERMLITSQTGEFAILERGVFDELVTGRLPVGSTAYLDLKAKGFLTHGPDATALRVAASQWRTKKAFLEGGPKLHIFVPTLRCNQSCGYCQASRADINACGVDMTQDNASLAIDVMLTAPSPRVVMEFQGGEALVAFDLVRWMIETTRARAAKADKDVAFVICTNLTLLTDEHLEFFGTHKVAVSTSLDGPPDVHDRNRPLPGASSYATVVANIRRCQTILGEGSVSALMTTTARSLINPKEIIDEYVKMGQGSIFLRELNPYGFAAKSAKAIGYDVDEFAAFYAEALRYIIDLNRHGTFIAEGYAKILLRKIMTPFGVGFVDLQSPTGEGFGVLLYNHDGHVYVSDEARMLAEMGDRTFCLGHVADGYHKLLFGETMQYIAAAGVAESLPGCSDCVYVPYCGADPIRHYRTQNDIAGYRPNSTFCRKQKAIFSILFDMLDTADDEIMNILLGWITPSRSQLPRAAWQS